MSTIEDGTGGGYKAEVNRLNQLVVRAITEADIDNVAETAEEAYAIIATDTGPTANEFTLYVRNDDDRDFIIVEIRTYNVDADVDWIFGTVTGTAATAPVIIPANTNLGSGKTADMTVLGGAGGVTGLTAVETMLNIKGGPVFTNTTLHTHLILPKNIAVAFEFNAGTGAAVQVGIIGYFKQD